MTAQVFELLQASSLTGTVSGQGLGQAVEVGSQVDVFVDITAGSGTITRFDAYVQASLDNVNWYDQPCDLTQKTDTTGAGVAAGTNKRNIVDNKTSNTVEKNLGRIKHFPAPYMRFGYVINATGSLTVGAKASTK